MDEEEDGQVEFLKKENRLNWGRVLDVDVETLLNGGEDPALLDDMFLPLITSRVDLSSPEATPENLLHLFRVMQLLSELKNMDMEDFAEEKDLLQEEVRQMKFERSQFQRGIDGSGASDTLRSEVSDLKDQRKKLENELADKDETLSAVRVQLSELQSTFEKQKGENLELTATCTNLKDEVASFRDQESKRRTSREADSAKMANAKLQLASKNRQIDKYLKELHDMGTVRGDLERQVHSLQKVANERDDIIHRLEKDISERRMLLKHSEEGIEELRTENSELRETVVELESCLVASEEKLLTAMDRYSSEAQELVEEKEEELDEKEKELETLREVTDRLKGELDELRSMDYGQKVKELTAQLADREDTIGKMAKEGSPGKGARSFLTPRSRQGSTIDFPPAGRTSATELRRLQVDLEIERNRIDNMAHELMEKDGKIATLLERIGKYEEGIYGMKEAQDDIRQHEKQLEFRDKDIAELTTRLNLRENQLEDLADEVQALRYRCGLGPDDHVDVSGLKLENQMELEKLRSLREHHEREIERLEEDRLYWKDAARSQALSRGEGTLMVGLTHDQMQKLKDVADGMRYGGEGEVVSSPDTGELLKFKKDLKESRRALEERGDKLLSAERDISRLSQENTELRRNLKEKIDELQKARSPPAPIAVRPAQSPRTEKDKEPMSPGLEKLMKHLDDDKHESAEELKLMEKELTAEREKTKLLGEQIRNYEEAQISLRSRIDELEGYVQRLEKAPGVIQATERDARVEKSTVEKPQMSPRIMDNVEISRLKNNLLRKEDLVNELKLKNRELESHVRSNAVEEEVEKLREDCQKKVEEALIETRALREENEIQKLKVTQLEEMQHAFETSSDSEIAKQLGETKRKLTILKVNEHVLGNRFKMMNETTDMLQKEVTKVRASAVEKHGEFKLKLRALEQELAESEARNDKLEEELDTSVSAKSYELCMNQLALSLENEKKRLEMEQDFVVLTKERNELKKTARDLEQEVEEMSLSLEAEKTRCRDLELTVTELSGKTGDEKSKTVAELSSRVSSLEVARKQAEERAISSKRRLASCQSEIERCESQVEKVTMELAQATCVIKEKSDSIASLRRDCDSRLCPEEEEKLRQQLNNVDVELKKTRNETANLKAVAEANFESLTAAKHLNEEMSAELTHLRDMLRDMQKKGDLQAMVGKLEYELMQGKSSQLDLRRECDQLRQTIQASAAEMKKQKTLLTGRSMESFVLKKRVRDEKRDKQELLNQITELKSGTVSVGEMEKLVEKLGEAESKVAAVVSAKELAEKEKRSLESEVEEMELELDSLRDQMTLLTRGDTSQMSGRLSELSQSILRMKLSQKRLERKLQLSQDRVEYLEGEHENAEAQLRASEETVVELEEKLHASEEENHVLQDKLDEQGPLAMSSDTVGGVTSDQVTELQEDIQERDERISELEKELEESVGKIEYEECKAEIEVLLQKEKKLLEMERNFMTATKERDVIKKTLQEIEVELEESKLSLDAEKSRCASLESSMAEMSRTTSDDKAKRVAELSSQVSSLETSAKQAEERATSSKQRLTACQQDVEKYEAEVRMLQDKVNTINRDSLEKEAALSRVEAIHRLCMKRDEQVSLRQQVMSLEQELEKVRGEFTSCHAALERERRGCLSARSTVEELNNRISELLKTVGESQKDGSTTAVVDTELSKLREHEVELCKKLEQTVEELEDAKGRLKAERGKGTARMVDIMMLRKRNRDGKRKIDGISRELSELKSVSISLREHEMKMNDVMSKQDEMLSELDHLRKLLNCKDNEIEECKTEQDELREQIALLRKSDSEGLSDKLASSAKFLLKMKILERRKRKELAEADSVQHKMKSELETKQGMLDDALGRISGLEAALSSIEQSHEKEMEDLEGHIADVPLQMAARNMESQSVPMMGQLGGEGEVGSLKVRLIELEGLLEDKQREIDMLKENVDDGGEMEVGAQDSEDGKNRIARVAQVTIRGLREQLMRKDETLKRYQDLLKKERETRLSEREVQASNVESLFDELKSESERNIQSLRAAVKDFDVPRTLPPVMDSRVDGVPPEEVTRMLDEKDRQISQLSITRQEGENSEFQLTQKIEEKNREIGLLKKELDLRTTHDRLVRTLKTQLADKDKENKNMKSAIKHLRRELVKLAEEGAEGRVRQVRERSGEEDVTAEKASKVKQRLVAVQERLLKTRDEVQSLREREKSALAQRDNALQQMQLQEEASLRQLDDVKRLQRQLKEAQTKEYRMREQLEKQTTSVEGGMVDELQKRISVLQRQLEGRKGNKEIESLRKRVMDADRRISDLKRELEREKKDKSEMEQKLLAEVTRLKHGQRNMEKDCGKEIEETHKHVEQLSVDHRKDLERERMHMDRVTESMKKERNQLNLEFQQRESELKKEIASLRRERDDLIRSQYGISHRKVDVEKISTPTKDEPKKPENEDEVARTRWEEGKKMKKKIESMRSKLQEKNNMLEELRRQMNPLVEEVKLLRKGKRDNEVAVEHARADLEKLRSARIDVETLGIVADLKSTIFHLENELSALKRACEVEKANEIRILNAEIAELKKKLGDAPAESSDGKDSDRKLLEAENSVVELRFDREDLLLKMRRYQDRVADLESLNGMLTSESPREFAFTVLGTDPSRKHRVSKTKEVKELEEVVRAMQRVVERLQKENEQLKKGTMASAKLSELSRSNKKLKESCNAMQKEIEDLRIKEKKATETGQRAARFSSLYSQNMKRLKQQKEEVEKHEKAAVELRLANEALQKELDSSKSVLENMEKDASMTVERTKIQFQEQLSVLEKNKETLSRQILVLRDDLQKRDDALGSLQEQVDTLKKHRDVGDDGGISEAVVDLRERVSLLQKERDELSEELDRMIGHEVSDEKGPYAADWHVQKKSLENRVAELQTENDSLRGELDAFDAGFFDEIFSLKQKFKELLKKNEMNENELKRLKQ